MKPELGYITEALVSRVVDGDTYEVEVTRRFAIRLQDERLYVNTAEKNEEAGLKCKEFCKNLLEGKKVTVFIPSNKPETFMDFNSFNRVLGQVWLGDKKVVDILEEKGMLIGKPEKEKK